MIKSWFKKLQVMWFEWKLKRNYHADTYVYEDE